MPLPRESVGISCGRVQCSPSVLVDITRSSSCVSLDSILASSPPVVALQFFSNWQSIHTRYTLPAPSIVADGSTLPLMLATSAVLLHDRPPSWEMKECRLMVL